MPTKAMCRKDARSQCLPVNLAIRIQRTYQECHQNLAMRQEAAKQIADPLLQTRNKAHFQALGLKVVRIFHTATSNHLEPNLPIRVRITPQRTSSIKILPSPTKAI